MRFLQLGERQGWCEGHERNVVLTASSLESIAAQPLRQRLPFQPRKKRGKGGWNRSRESWKWRRRSSRRSLFRITITIRNCVALGTAASLLNRDEALLRSLISVHSILHVDGGEFVSLLDPPEALRAAAAACQNIGTWPVLVGEEGARDTMLSAPIILYDYPQIAPESPGDFFDGTEIDEILALRILTMTDAEKLEVRGSDDRARKILERTEMLPPEHFQKLHGALRGLRAGPGRRNERVGMASARGQDRRSIA